MNFTSKQLSDFAEYMSDLAKMQMEDAKRLNILPMIIQYESEMYVWASLPERFKLFLEEGKEKNGNA